MNRLVRVVVAHARTAAAIAAGLLCYAVLIPTVAEPTRSIVAWDGFAAVFLALHVVMMARDSPEQIPANAEAARELEWGTFWLVLLGVAFSFLAIIGDFSGTKELPPAVKRFHIGLVIGTLIVTWLVTQAAFALRYAHEYYTTGSGGTLDKGLDFPGGEAPDYWDFVYFSVVLGMTFQVSDVQITARGLRRLATVHGLFGFGFNTVIVALTVNLAANLL